MPMKTETVTAWCTVLLAAAWLVVTGSTSVHAQHAPKHAVMEIDVTVGREHVHEFIERLHDLAKANDFTIQVGYPSPSAITFYLVRDDLEVVAINPHDIESFLIFLYDGNKKTDSAICGEFVRAFRNAVSTVPTVQITVKSEP
jgi:hypothetical protein